MIKPKERYDEVFEIEVDGWCAAIARFSGEVDAALVHRLIREFGLSIRRAVMLHYAFDALTVAQRFSKAAKYIVSEKELVYCVMCQLPRPDTIDEEGRYILAIIVDQVEQAYQGVLARLERKWRSEKLEEDRKRQPAPVAPKSATNRGAPFRPPSQTQKVIPPWVTANVSR